MIAQSDIIYFALTDRFRDGDPANNFDVDRNNPFAYHGGDFAGIIEKIPYLKNLGITALWISPVYVNSHLKDNNMWGYHGYWPLDFDRIDPHLYSPAEGIGAGSREYLKRLADELHGNGIKLILDMVVNHTGYNHPGLSPDSPLTPFRPHWFNPESLKSVEEGRLMGLPDIDQDNIEVVDYFINSVTGWIEDTGIDAIRMDTAKHVERAFWHHFKTYIKGKHPEVSLLGEVLEWDIDRISEYQKHYAFDYLFDFPLQNAMHEVFLKDRSLRTLASPRIDPNEPLGVLDRDTHYTNHNKLVTLMDNHDLPLRFMTAALNATSGDRQRALDIYLLALTFIMTTRGVPQLYYGSEIAMEGGADPDNRRDMPWEMFDVHEPKAEWETERKAFDHVKRLIELRKSNDALMFGSLITLYVDDFVYVYLREFCGNIVITAVNNGRLEMQWPLRIGFSSHSAIAPRVKGLLDKCKGLSDARDIIKINDGGFNIKLNAKSALILRPVYR